MKENHAQLEAAKAWLELNGCQDPHDCGHCRRLVENLAARDEAKDAELAVLRAIVGDAASRSVMRREIAQGRVEAWLKEHDAEASARAVAPWVAWAERVQPIIDAALVVRAHPRQWRELIVPCHRMRNPLSFGLPRADKPSAAPTPPAPRPQPGDEGHDHGEIDLNGEGATQDIICPGCAPAPAEKKPCACDGAGCFKCGDAL